MKADKLSTLSRVPSSWIHSVLKSLVDKGLVESEGSWPKTYRAVPIRTILPELEKKLKEKLKRSRRLLLSLEKAGEQKGEPIRALLFVGESLFQRLKEYIQSSNRLIAIVNRSDEEVLSLVKQKENVKLELRDHGVTALATRESVFVVFRVGKERLGLGALVFSRRLSKLVEREFQA